MANDTRSTPNLRGIWTDRAQQTVRPKDGFIKLILGGLKPAALRRMTPSTGTHTRLEKSNG